MNEQEASKNVLSPEAYKAYAARLADGRSIQGIMNWPKLVERDKEGEIVRESAGKPKLTNTPVFWASLKLYSEKLGHPLTLEEFLEVVNIDKSATVTGGAELVECALCKAEVENGARDKTQSVTFTPIRIAVFRRGKNGEPTGEPVRDKETNEIVYAGNFVRFLVEGEWQILGGEGNPFNPRSHSHALRTLRSEEKTDLAMTYEAAKEAVQRSLAKHEQGRKKADATRGLKESLFGRREHREGLPPLGARLRPSGE